MIKAITFTGDHRRSQGNFGTNAALVVTTGAIGSGVGYVYGLSRGYGKDEFRKVGADMELRHSIKKGEIDKINKLKRSIDNVNKDSELKLLDSKLNKVTKNLDKNLDKITQKVLNNEKAYDKFAKMFEEAKAQNPDLYKSVARKIKMLNGKVPTVAEVNRAGTIALIQQNTLFSQSNKVEHLMSKIASRKDELIKQVQPEIVKLKKNMAQTINQLAQEKKGVPRSYKQYEANFIKRLKGPKGEIIAKMVESKISKNAAKTAAKKFGIFLAGLTAISLLFRPVRLNSDCKDC